MPRCFLVKNRFIPKRPRYWEIDDETGEVLPPAEHVAVGLLWDLYSPSVSNPLPPATPPSSSDSPSSSSGQQEGGSTSDPPTPELPRRQSSRTKALGRREPSPAGASKGPGAAAASFPCARCSEECRSASDLKVHMRSHPLPCVCPTCGKGFSRPWLLQGHIRTHTGERPFSCPQCSRAFADRSNLRAHQQTHEEVKRHRCDSCTRTFSRASLLRKHVASGCAGGRV